MSDKRIEYFLNVGGAAVPLTSVVFNDSTASWGVRRVDTGAVVLAAGTALDPDGVTANHYEKTLTGLTAGVTYQYAIQSVYEGDTDRLVRSFIAAADGIAWHYAAQEDVADIAGLENLTIVSDTDPTTIELDTSRLLRAGEWSDAYIDGRLNGAVWTLPLASMTIGQARLMKDISARLVLWWLYQFKGIRDIDPVNPPKGVAGYFENHKKIADLGLKRMWRGELGAQRRGGRTNPIGVPQSPLSLVCVDDVRYPTVL